MTTKELTPADEGYVDPLVIAQNEALSAPQPTDDDRLRALVGVVQRIADHLGIDVSDVALDSVVSARLDEQTTLELDR